jgi:hypothetical protein
MAQDDRRLIYLSARGRQISETIFNCLRQLHAEWAEDIGHERFDIFIEVLKQLSVKAQERTLKAGQ